MLELETMFHLHKSAQDGDLERPDPFLLIIFGGTGDLAKRKLIPACYNLFREGLLKEPFAVMGVSRRASSVEAFRDLHHESTSKFSPLFDEEIWRRFAPSLTCMSGDVYKEEMYDALRKQIEEIDRERGTNGNRIFYFSTPPKVFPVILSHLTKAGLIQKQAPSSKSWQRIIIEKPFGRDLASARRLNQTLLEMLEEDQIFRIDHYLGKETVQNILVFRFGNSIFEPLWNRKFIDCVQITALEDISIEGRASFYEETGVFRDIVQNHLLEILSLCSMEMPVTFQANDIRDQKLQLLRSLRPLLGSAIQNHTVYGQYKGYREEADVSPDSHTPTYAAMKVMVDNWRWQGVPFYLRAGKALQRRVTEIAIQFNPIPFCLFGREDVCQMIDPNVLIMRIQPDEGISLRFVCKEPGDRLKIGNVDMNFKYAAGFERRPPEAYERLLLDCARGDLTLFARKDAIERAWEFMDPVIQAIEVEPSLPLVFYEKGSLGPEEANSLLVRDGNRWQEIR